jgi:uncharacterized protein (DUF1501 family)
MSNCGCNDWMTTQRRTMLRRQGDRVPLPRAVLEGATAGLSRRDFLRNGAVGFLTVYGAQALSWSRIWEAAAASAAAPSGDPIIVSIFLDGGNDGLNTLVPITGANYSAYVTKRPHIKLDPAGCLPLAGPAASPDFAWNPNATGLRSLYDAGKMAVIPAVDYMPPDLSHFHSRAFWQAGELVADPSVGWLGKWIDQNGVADNPLQALSVDWSLDGSLKSEDNPVAVLTSVDDAQFSMGTVWQDPSLMVDTLDSLTQRTAASTAMAAADNALGGAVTIANELAGLPDTTLPPTGVGYDTSDPTSFEQRLSTLAWLISSNVGIRVACLSYDEGFDFHDSQVDRQGGIMTRLSRGLAAFQADLEARGIADRVITLVWSEFGRRVEDNDSGGGGTDHGAGGLAMVIGTGVKPGIASEFPGIRDQDLDEWGNLKVPTDYRQIYTSLLADWMGTDPADVIPNAAGYPALDLVA